MRIHRSFAPVVLVLAAFLALGLTPGRAASPAGGSVSATSPTTSWTGGPFLAFNPAEQTDCVVADAPFCDEFALEIGALAPDRPDVLVSAIASSDSDMINLAVYDADGDVVAESSYLGSSQTVALRAPGAGSYSVRVELLLGVPGSSTYTGRATAGVAGPPVDLEQDCVVEETGVVLEADDGRSVDLDVLVLLDGVDEAYARGFFDQVSAPYEELGIRVVPTFEIADPPFKSTVTVDLIQEARSRFTEGKVPPQYDVVEVLTAKDLELFGQSAVAGQADCLGGVAYDTRAYNVSEARVPGIPPEGIRFGPLTLGANYAAKITAHEIGHLLGGQHHYANCVEGIDPEAESSDTSPCSLMFNAADFVSLDFGTVNGAIVRGYAVKYASANDIDVEPPCLKPHKKKGCR